jgi:MoxR-like ATPase
MTTHVLTPEQLDASRQLVADLRRELAKLFIGQEQLVEGVLTAIAAGGHVLVEALPGLGKTLLVKAIGRILGLKTNRIQFTPDLMPSDITGSHVFDMAERRFVFHPGPVFTQFLLADEFNRAPAKTHSALLEVMQESQVTLDGTHHPLAPPFLVLATQNPIENEGTYNLPEAQLDRFLFKLAMTYPEQADEERIYGLFLAGESPERILANDVQPVADAARVLELQRCAALVTVDGTLVSYIAALVRRSRGFPGLYLGASPRAGIAMLTASRALALARGRGFVVPDDIVDVALPALRHRVILSPEAEVEGRTADAILGEMIRSVAVPRGVKA